MKIAAALLALCLAGSVIAQTNGAVKPPPEQLGKPATDPYTGFVTDSTVTFVGQEFYRAFVTKWREMPLVDRYVVNIFERPSARWGSLVWVEYSHKRLYSTFLSPARRDAIRASAEYAAQSTYESIVEQDVTRLLFRDADLAPEEF